MEPEHSAVTQHGPVSLHPIITAPGILGQLPFGGCGCMHRPANGEGRALQLMSNTTQLHSTQKTVLLLGKHKAISSSLHLTRADTSGVPSSSEALWSTHSPLSSQGRLPAAGAGP